MPGCVQRICSLFVTTIFILYTSPISRPANPCNASQVTMAHNSGVDQASMEREKENFYAYSKLSNIPHVDNWPSDSHILVTGSVRAPNVVYEIEPPSHLHISENKHLTSYPQTLPTDGSVIRFNGPLFEGNIVHRVRCEAPVSNLVSHSKVAANPITESSNKRISRLVKIFNSHSRLLLDSKYVTFQ